MNPIMIFASSYILLIVVIALLLTYYFKVIRPKDEKELQEWMDKMKEAGEE